VKTRSGPNGGTFRATGVRLPQPVALERLDDYLAELAAKGELDAARYEVERRKGEAERSAEEDGLIEPVRIETEGLRWAVARVAPGAERRVARDLAGEGLTAYCPLGRRLATQGRVVVNGLRRRRRVMRQFVVFSPYLFLGCAPAREVGRDIRDRSGERIGTVIGDATGPTWVAPRIIAEINALEIAGQWWENWAGQTRLKPGAEVVVKAGAFAELRGIVEALPAEMRVTIDLDLFGRPTPVTLDVCQVDLI
jgi:transcription antitermination factor NusG